jgi:hypothetical protein
MSRRTRLCLAWFRGQAVEKVVVPLMPLQVWRETECDSVVLLNNITIRPDTDLSVPKHQVLKLLEENLSIPPAPLALALVLGKSTMNSRCNRRCRKEGWCPSSSWWGGRVARWLLPHLFLPPHWRRHSGGSHLSWRTPWKPLLKRALVHRFDLASRPPTPVCRQRVMPPEGGACWRRPSPRCQSLALMLRTMGLSWAPVPSRTLRR